MDRHEERFKAEKEMLQKWRNSLHQGTSKIKIICLDFPIFSERTFPSRIAMMPELTSTEALPWKARKKIEQEDDEENVEPIVSSKVYSLSVPGSNNLNDSFFPGEYNTSLTLSQNFCFPNLQSICVSRCHKLKSIFSLTIVSSLPNLQSLIVEECNGLEAVISPYSIEAAQHRNLSSPPHQVSLPKLKTIKITECRNLRNIFFRVILSSLPQLELLHIWDCNELEDILCSDEKAIINLPTFSEQVYFPTLQKIVIGRCNKLKIIFSLIIVRSLPELVSMSVILCDELEGVFTFDSEEAGEVAQISALSQQVYFPKLQEILIAMCEKLKTIFSFTNVTLMPELSCLQVEDCNELEEIFSFDSEEEGQVEQVSAPTQQVYFPKLQRIGIRSCNKLKTIFSLIIFRSLPMLESLCVEYCNEWEKVFSQQVCVPKIRIITIQCCDKLKCIFPYSVAIHCSSLCNINIQNCSQLEHIVNFELNAKSEQESAGEAVFFNRQEKTKQGKKNKKKQRKKSGKRILFQKLRQLLLYNLPNLSGTLPWKKSPYCSLRIKDCPKCLEFT
ncbi:hypothetical protein VNO78_27538 [Psophocarpus tetragonolobus]|uniref:Disease resistance protein At4g27190-like leucine-rich repeats domain-containing protein n=1 Tax=Psophocarpus tetragonolobus TaxID=3891 RepID=A0AAN9S0U2_PSOTE